MKQVRPFEDECVRIKKIIDKLEMEKWVQPHPKCPDCGSMKSAFIFWGMGIANQEEEEAVKRKEIVLGMNLITDHNPKWECNDCHYQWGERDDD